MHASNRRKLSNFLVEPKFQVRYLALLIGSAMVPISLCAGVLVYFVRQNYLLLINYAALDPDTTALLLWELKFLTAVIGATFICFLGLIALLGAVFSHRIAGVVYNTRKTCREVASGKNVELKFRDRDEFQELSSDFNGMIRSLKGKQLERAV